VQGLRGDDAVGRHWHAESAAPIFESQDYGRGAAIVAK
jgi:hypothetical protein